MQIVQIIIRRPKLVTTELKIYQLCTYDNISFFGNSNVTWNKIKNSVTYTLVTIVIQSVNKHCTCVNKFLLK